uniref:Uncharacterized protein n=1 Tax=Arundo donax TaxID=35708 RepID=A0A0A9A4Z1_ARUDO
MEHGASST